MSNKGYYERWLQIKEEIKTGIKDDDRLQELAVSEIGIKPQSKAVEVVAKVYGKYCNLYNRLCECYDQMEQVQRRPYIKKILDAITCRLLELKTTLEEVELFEYTYPDNGLQQLRMTPKNIEILCPFHYPFETRQEEMQYIIDEIFAGHRLGDPSPTPSEIEQRKQEQLLEQERLREEKEADIKRKLAMGEEISVSEASIKLSPQELEKLRLEKEYNDHLNNIQRMERARYATREIFHKINKDANLYLELAGLKTPPARESLRIKAASLIQNIYRKFMNLKRENATLNKMKLKLGMIIPPYTPPSAKIQSERVKDERRKFRRIYYEKWLKENLKENSRVLRLREGNIMEDISDEIRQWLNEWYTQIRVFDEFPWPEEGGSILIVKGETFTVEEYIEWVAEEEKRLKALAGTPKTKEQIKAEKIAAKQEKKRKEEEEKIRQAKKLLDYKKQRMNPDNDPGVYIKIAKMIDPVHEAWQYYQTQWKDIDKADAALNVLQGYIKQLITEDAYAAAQTKLRPIVDDMMRLELKLLRNSLMADLEAAEVKKLPLIKKRKKPRKVKPPKPFKIPTTSMFQVLVDGGIVVKYPRLTLEDYWGDLNYAASDTRGILWTPTFPPPCIGDVREQVRVRCLLTLCSSCPNAVRSQLLVGPKGSGKRSLIYAIATETNSILIDLSPFNVYNKFPGPKNLKTMFVYVNNICRLMQPAIIMVDNADKMFCMKVAKEDKLFDPKRLQKDFFKEIIKPIQVSADKILVLGTATEPWLAKTALMYKVFPSLIMVPRSDYGSISLILNRVLMKYHGLSRDFNLHSVAQTLRGYNIKSIKQGLENLMTGTRVSQLYYKPLEPWEVINAVLGSKGVGFTDSTDMDMYKQWYESYSPWGKKAVDYNMILESQLAYKLKAEKK